VCRLGVWRCWSFASSWWFFPARCISSISPRFYLRKLAFYFLPLVTIFLILTNISLWLPTHVHF
jgi:hypothetical protein